MHLISVRSLLRPSGGVRGSQETRNIELGLDQDFERIFRTLSDQMSVAKVSVPGGPDAGKIIASQANLLCFAVPKADRSIGRLKKKTRFACTGRALISGSRS